MLYPETGHTGTGRIVRIFLDASIGLAVFLLIAGAFGSDRLVNGGYRFGDVLAITANAEEYAKTVRPAAPAAMSTVYSGTAKAVTGPETQFKSTNRQTAFLLLAAVFSVLFAFNLAFFRHLRRVYAVPNRNGPRRRY